MAAELDIADESFLVAAPAAVAAVLADASVWRDWWPDLELALEEDRGDEGLRWTVRGSVTGTAEIWLEPWWDGTIVHWFVRGTARRSGDVTRRRTVMIRHHKARIHALKDQLERTRHRRNPT